MIVLLLALSGFELLEFSAFADVLGWATAVSLKDGRRRPTLSAAVTDKNS